MKEFRALLRKKVDRLFLVLWPPWGEQKIADIDVSFGFIFNDDPNRLCIIKVDKDELWSPHIYYHSLPQNEYSWEDFHSRIKMWMEAENDNCIIDTEYYDVTKTVLFKDIVGSEIIRMEGLYIEGNPDPFGIKIIFENDYIISTPISDGNTVETSQFNQNNNVTVFQYFGKIKYKEIT